MDDTAELKANQDTLLALVTQHKPMLQTLDAAIEAAGGIPNAILGALGQSPAGDDSEPPRTQAITEPTEVHYNVVHQPMVRLEGCPCGVSPMLADNDSIASARAGRDLLPVRCRCGRVLQGVRQLIQPGKSKIILER